MTRVAVIPLAEISEAAVVRPSSLAFLKGHDTVMLTLSDGSLRFITPFPAEEFCKYFNRRKSEHAEDE